MRIQVDLHEQADEFARLVHVQAVFLGGADDGVGELAVALGDDARRAVRFVV